MAYKYLFAKNFEDNIKAITRVDYAGEMAAVNIYKAQIRMLPHGVHLNEMLDSEITHFEYFKRLNEVLGIKKTVFLPIWAKISTVLGYASAKVSYSDAMLLTQAVEEAIEEHYAEQIKELTDILHYANEYDLYIKENYDILQNLLAQIKMFIQDEISHKNIGQKNSHMKVVRYTLASLITKLAVLLSKKY